MSSLPFSRLPLFHWRFFFNERLAFFGVDSFFIGDLLNGPMNKGSDSALLFMAPIVCVKRLLNFQLTLLVVSTLL
jgi:hypothetical protein